MPSDYCELPEFYRTVWPVAKKEYPCTECRAPILKGEKYCRTTAKWDGDVSCFKQHLACEDACRYWRDHMLSGGECLYFGELLEMDQDFYSNPKDPADVKTRDFRKLIARIKFRQEKGRYPTFLGPLALTLKLDRLEADRAKKVY